MHTSSPLTISRSNIEFFHDAVDGTKIAACYLLSFGKRLHSGQSPFITQLISSTSKSLGRGMLDVVISLMQNVLWQDVQVK